MTVIWSKTKTRLSYKIKLSNMESKYVTTSDYNRFRNDSFIDNTNLDKKSD